MIRYRTESYSGTGIRDAASIMAFEAFELGNDMSDYLLNKTDYIKDKNLRRELEAVSLYYCSEKDVIKTPPSLIHFRDCEDDSDIAFWERIFAEIAKNTGKNIKYALWLADWDKVTDRDQHNGGYGYDMGENPDTDAYEVSDIILCDLGTDGALYGYEDYPEPMASNLIKKISE